MKWFVIVLILFTALPAHAATKFEVSGWLPYWRAATSTADARAHLDAFTEINPFGYTVKTDGTLKDLMGSDDEPWISLIRDAQAKKVRVIPTIMWSDAEAMHRILSNYTTRVALEDEIRDLVEAKGFDGIDIDFEGKRYETRNYYSTFLKGLHMRFPKKWVMCTTESRTPIASQYELPPPKEAGMYANDYTALNKYCDRVRIMAYDQGSIDLTLNAAAGQSPYVPVADVRWVEKTVKEALKHIAKNKISIGVPTYGYEFAVTPLTEQGFRYDRLWAFNQQYAFDLMVEYVVNVKRNVAGELSFTYIPTPHAVDPQPTLVQNAASANPGTYNIVWWSDARAIQDKITLAKKLGVRGISIFKIDGGEDPALWDILPKLH